MVGMRFIGLFLVLIAYSILIDKPSLAAFLPEAASPVTMKQVAATMMGMPLQFEMNKGQVDAQVRFLARGKGYTLFLTPTESVMVLQQREATAEKDLRALTGPSALPESAPIKQAIVRMKLEGANPTPAIEGMEQLPGIVNYFIGNESEKWRTNIPTYAKVQYQEAYPGIDLAYYGNQGRLEYDFIVAPGADPDQIKLAFEGESDIRLADSGDLFLTTALGEVRLQKPVVYQLETNGHKTLIAGYYVLEPTLSLAGRGNGEGTIHASRRTNHEIAIQLAAYDHSKPLVIDPVLVYSTYLGGSGDDYGRSIAVDSTGNAYVTGYTTSLCGASSSPFPTAPTAGPLQACNNSSNGAAFDAFVTKFSASGATVSYSTYLGGHHDDYGYSIAVDSGGNAYVTGYTRSDNFPLPPSPPIPPMQGAFGGGYGDVFVAKLNATGAGLVYSTYWGGSGDDAGFGIAVDNLNQAYVTGETWGILPPPCPATNLGNSDVIVGKLSANGASLLYCNVFGGNTLDSGTAIDVDNSGGIYITGWTDSSNFPSYYQDGPAQLPFEKAAGRDAFVAKFSDAAPLPLQPLYSVIFGGGGGDEGTGIAVDTSSGVAEAIITGNTGSPFSFSISNAYQNTPGGGASDAFIAKVSASGTPVFSTYLGGSGNDTGGGVAVESSGKIVATGATSSPNFPVYPLPGDVPANVQAIKSGGIDAFITKLNATGSTLEYSTYLGGGENDIGLGVTVGSAGQIYVTGFTYSGSPFAPSPTPFPTQSPFQAVHGGGTYDVFVAKLSDSVPPVCNLATPSLNSLWPPNQAMVPVSINGITDPNDPAVSITYPQVTQDEPLVGLFVRDLSPDAAVSGQQILLRAERGPRRDGRVYEVHFTATNSQGGSCSGTVQVSVPRRKNATAVNSGQTYYSFGP